MYYERESEKLVEMEKAVRKKTHGKHDFFEKKKRLVHFRNRWVFWLCSVLEVLRLSVLHLILQVRVMWREIVGETERQSCCLYSARFPL